MLDDLFVDILSVPNLEDCDLLSPVINQVDNPIIALSDAVAIVVPG
jgi:hypothetical protein